MKLKVSAQLLLKGVQTIETFTEADEQDPSTWLQISDEIFNAVKMEKKDRRQLLRMYFGNDVKNCYRSEEHDSDYDIFKEEFVKTFTSSSYRLKIYSKIVDRRQRLDEAVQSYYYDILSLCSKLNRDMLENEKILHLLRGLKPSILQHFMMYDPKTCKDLLEQAKRAEAAADITQPQTAISATVTTEEIAETTAALRRLSTNNNNYQTRESSGYQQPSPNYQQRRPAQTYNNNKQMRQQRRGGSSNLVCYNCYGTGHFA